MEVDESRPFFMWSLADVWRWLIDFPSLGFIALIICALLGLVLMVGTIYAVTRD